MGTRPPAATTQRPPGDAAQQRRRPAAFPLISNPMRAGQGPVTTASGPRPGTWQAITTPCCAQHLAGDHDAPAAPSVVWHRPPPLTPTAGRSLVNLAKRNISQLAALARTRLKRMPYRPRRINSYLAKTGLGLTLP